MRQTKHVEEQKEEVKEVKRERSLEEQALQYSNELSKFIVGQAKQGVPKSKVRKSLLAQGWSEELVDKYIEYFYAR